MDGVLRSGIPNSFLLCCQNTDSYIKLLNSNVYVYLIGSSYLPSNFCSQTPLFCSRTPRKTSIQSPKPLGQVLPAGWSERSSQTLGRSPVDDAPTPHPPPGLGEATSACPVRILLGNGLARRASWPTQRTPGGPEKQARRRSRTAAETSGM